MFNLNDPPSLNQQWKFVPTSNAPIIQPGTYFIVNAQTGTLMDLPNFVTTPGTAIIGPHYPSFSCLALTRPYRLSTERRRQSKGKIALMTAMIRLLTLHEQWIVTSTSDVNTYSIKCKTGGVFASHVQTKQDPQYLTLQASDKADNWLITPGTQPGAY
jgi:hypothetical protein